MKAALKKSLLLTTIIFMDLLAGMEFDLFVPSFPQLQDHFSLSPFWVESLLSSNFTGYFISLFFVGSLADRYGRKPIITFGLMTFVIGSLMCLYIPSFTWLLIGRFLQGVGVAAPAILSFLIIADTYPLKQQQFLFAMLNGVKNAAIGIAPVIGSYIALYFHWQGNFTALLGLGIVTLLMTIAFIPHFKTEHKDLLSLPGYKTIFRSQPLMLIIISLILCFVPYWIFVGMSPLLYIKDLGVSLTHFGYYQGIFAFTFAVGCVIYGLVINRFDQVKMLYGSVLLNLICLAAIALCLKSTNPIAITAAFMPFVIGQIIPSTITYPLSLNLIPRAKGRVSALTQGASLVLLSIGLQIAGYYYRGSFFNVGIVMLITLLLSTVSLLLVAHNKKIQTLIRAETV